LIKLQLQLKIAMLQRGVRQTRMAFEIGMDPAKLSRIVNGVAIPSPDDRRKIASYLEMNEATLFEKNRQKRHPLPAA
jgi:transcriptional regulator with XRE-family HTH domain